MHTETYLQAANSLLFFPLNQYISNMSIDIPPKSESIILMDAKGNIEYINPVFSKISGYSAEEANELNFKKVVSDEVTEYNLMNLWNTILSGKEWNGNLPFKTKNGEVELFRTTISPVKNKTGKVAHFIIIKSPITELGEDEKKIINLIRLGYFGNLFCSLMHELKSHFALIKMNFNLLKPSSISERNIYSIIDRDLERVNKLFLNFSQLSKNKDLELIELNIHNVIDYSFSSVVPLLQNKKIKFSNNVEPFLIKGDYQKLKCVFRNLIENAIDAIESAGEIEVWSKKGRGYFIIYFKDNGIGIKNCDKVFEPLYTTKANGTGLGLAIVKKIIEEHKGVINLSKSQEGETIFEIKYPLYI
jgi:PAS domain S-box-containing protein